MTSHVIHRNLKHPPPALAHADGMYVVDKAGKTYLDGTAGGVAVSCLGHGNGEVEAAIMTQMRECAYMHSSIFTTDATESLAEFLSARAPGDLGSVCLVSGGSEATDTALKMVRQYMLETGQPNRTRIISRRQSFHGNTIGALSVGGNQPRRMAYEPFLFDVPLIDPCYAYRFQGATETEEAYGARSAQALEDAILAAGPETVAAFIAEPVVGATLGCVPAVSGYLQKIRQICDRYGVLLILDEIMCGAGRTGTLFACEQDGVVPDLLLLAKGLGGGFQSIGAVIARTSIAEVLASGSGTLKHGFTYMGHATACAAALAVQTIIERDGILAKVTDSGEALRGALTDRLGQHPNVGDIRGRGLFLGLEFVADRETKEPINPEIGFSAHLKSAALENGLICYPSGGTLDGRLGDHALLSPAYIIEPKHIDELVDKFAVSIDRAKQLAGGL